jgi:iron complex transport system ATP-binding protein
MGEIAVRGMNLTLGYLRGSSRKEILVDLNFSLFSGELTCLLGPNGVGKSTLVKAILGELTPWHGEIRLKGKRIHSYSNENLSKQLSVVLTQPVFPGNMTVGQLVALGRIPHTSWTGKLSFADGKVIEQSMESTKISYLKDERLGEISDGQRQKAMIARALAQDGQVMVLDEPTAHLDLVNRFEIMGLLHEIAISQNKAVLVVTHDLEIALETADRFWLMNCGLPLIAGLPEDLVISGQINKLLPSEKFKFSVERGRIESSTSQISFQLSGSPELIPWLKNALVKAGIYSLDFPIHITNEPIAINYQDHAYRSVEHFLEAVKK